MCLSDKIFFKSRHLKGDSYYGSEENSYILIVCGVMCAFLSALRHFSQTSSIVLVSVGMFLCFSGICIKAILFQQSTGKKINNTGMGFCSSLTLVFIILKLTGEKGQGNRLNATIIP